METKSVVLKSVWEEQQAEIKKIFAPKLSDIEFKVFLELGRATGANPFKKEIWAVKTSDNEPPAIFLARDFYRKRANEMPDYEGHYCGVVCENDIFVMGVKDNTPTISDHTFNFKSRGPVKMAYCIVYRKNRKPFIVPVMIEEYIKRRNDGQVTKFWQKPHMMLSKVAEATALRMAYPSEFQGTYSEDEDWHDENIIDLKVDQTGEMEQVAASASKKELLKAMSDPEFQKFMSDAEKSGSKATTAELYNEYLNRKNKLAPAALPAKTTSATTTETAEAATESTTATIAATKTTVENQPVAETAAAKKLKPKWYKERILCTMAPEVNKLWKAAGSDMKSLVALYIKYDGDEAKIAVELQGLTPEPPADATTSFEDAAFEAPLPGAAAAEEPAKEKKEFKDVRNDVGPVITAELRQKFFTLGTVPKKVLEAFNTFCCYDESPEAQAKILADIEARPDHYVTAKKGATA